MRAQSIMNLENRLGEVLSSEDLTSLDVREFERQPELVRAIQVWDEMRKRIREQQRTDWPDGEELVLCALDASGHSSDLTAEERDIVANIRPKFKSALQGHPALQDIVDDIGRDRDAFESIWASHQRPRILRIPPAIWRIAAAVALVGIIGILAVILTQRTRDWNVVVVASEDIQQVDLPDGSMLRLVGPAELRYKPDEFDRSVLLNGGAFFDVDSQPGPFAVYTDEAVTNVLGTRFGVLDLDGHTEVVVESGRVEVASEDALAESVILEPGQMTRVSTGMAPTPPVDQNITQALAWTGILFFRATPMHEVAELLSARFGVDVSFDASLATESVTGTFDADESVEQIIGVLAIALDATASSSAAGWHIAAR